MAEVISLSERRRAKDGPGEPASRRAPRVTFSFDLASPATYLAAERVDRAFPGVRWEPALLAGGATYGARERLLSMLAAEQRAAALSVPLVWPDPFPCDARAAMRVASLACELGRGATFVLAASRLAFCGGFSLSDVDVLAEAAAAAGIPLEWCLAAARDGDRDRRLRAAGRRLVSGGGDRLPALRVGRTLFCGEERLAEAAAAAQTAEAGGWHVAG